MVNKASLAEKAVQSGVTFKGLTDADLEAARERIDTETAALSESMENTDDSVGAQVSEGQSTDITGGATDAEIVQFNTLIAMGKITLAEWDEMTAAERKQDGLPATLQDVNTLGIGNFDIDGTSGLNN